VRRLRDLQLASLSAGEATTGCRVVAHSGAQAVLVPEDHPSELLNLPLPAVLSFETGSHPVMLSGTVGDGPAGGTLRFMIGDAVGLPEHRLRPRMPVACRVEVTSLGSASGIVHALQTVDLGAGGVHIAGLRGVLGDRFALHIEVPGLIEPVRCTAAIVQVSADGAGLRFEDLDESVADAIEVVAYAVLVGLARRAISPPRPGHRI
jgi:hypothetical protein